MDLIIFVSVVVSDRLYGLTSFASHLIKTRLSQPNVSLNTKIQLMFFYKTFRSFVLLFVSSYFVSAQPNAKLIRDADVSDSHIVFQYATGLWIVSKRGGEAKQLTVMQGSFPRFSPDNKRIAFTAAEDVYVVSVKGGNPIRVTHHPLPDNMVDWFPDGKNAAQGSFF